jgi:hypothetical protein
MLRTCPRCCFLRPASDDERNKELHFPLVVRVLATDFVEEEAFLCSTLPTFAAALSKNDAIKWRPGDFKAFLVEWHFAL